MILIATFDSKVQVDSPRWHRPKPPGAHRWLINVWAKGPTGEAKHQLRPKQPCLYRDLLPLIQTTINELLVDTGGAEHMKFEVFKAR
jgi:hypothetical protein